MFTGIIQNLGTVTTRKQQRGQVRFGFKLKAKETRRLTEGQSIAVNGVCLTAAKVKKDGFEADVMAQTLEATSLGSLRKGNAVNIERSLRYGDELGGHFVTGHVDKCAELLAITKQGKNYTLRIESPQLLRPYLAPKGSVAVDGISLTIQKVKKTWFEIGIIPHTWKVTNLSNKKVGDIVNLEIDLIARYMHTFEQQLPKKVKKRKSLSVARLRKSGF